jgi:hypothetical protein
VPQTLCAELSPQEMVGGFCNFRGAIAKFRGAAGRPEQQHSLREQAPEAQHEISVTSRCRTVSVFAVMIAL